MTRTPGPPRRRRPALVLVAGIVGLLAAAASLWWAFLLIAFGGLLSGGWPLVFTLCQSVAGSLAGWGAVRLLRGRGWVPLALGALLGTQPLVRGLEDWFAFGVPAATDVFHAGLAVLPPLALALVLLPPVRGWAAPRPAVSRS